MENKTDQQNRQLGSFRIVPNQATEQAETIAAFSEEAAIADFQSRRPNVEIWDVIILRMSR